MKQVHVKVRSDHLERQVSVAKPILAVTELVWNALDADAKKVRVELGYNKMNGLKSITVIDNGHGLSYADAIPAFENLGGSWKSSQAKSKSEGRLLHGKAGKGRFRAFFLGDQVTWKTFYEDQGSVQQLTIQGTRSKLGVFTLNEPIPAKRERTGTEVKISEIQRNFPSLEGRTLSRKWPGSSPSTCGSTLLFRFLTTGPWWIQVPSRTLSLITRLAKSAWTMIGS